MIRRGLLIAGILFGLLPSGPAHAGTLLEVEIEGTINPAVADYVEDAMVHAEEQGVEAVLIRLNTPGGLLESTRTIVEELLSAPVPVIVWVAPGGARAASAGMFITLAAHVAVMAPGTNIGAATPISSGGKDVQQEGGEDLARKVLEDTSAFARSIADVRDRPRDWMERAVTEAISATAKEALELGVIDLMASDRDALLETLDGRSVEIAGASRSLRTAGATVEAMSMNAGQRLMHWLAHPNIAYILFLVGILGIYFELSQPGGFVAGTLGAISLLLAFISMQVLPFHIGGLALILLSIVLFIAEIFVPSFGILAAGGFVSFVVGSLILFDAPELGLTLDPWIVAGAAAAFGSIMLVVGYLVVRTYRQQTPTGSEGMADAPAEALTDLDPDGKVFLLGEIWKARLADSTEHVARGATVFVERTEGLRLVVRPTPAHESPAEAGDSEPEDREEG